MQSWQPTQEQQRAWEEEGYYILRGVVSSEEAAEMRGVIKNVIRPSRTR